MFMYRQRLAINYVLDSGMALHLGESYAVHTFALHGQPEMLPQIAICDLAPSGLGSTNLDGLDVEPGSGQEGSAIAGKMDWSICAQTKDPGYKLGSR